MSKNYMIIIGAGPVGLYLAYQLLLQKPELYLIHIEKRSQFTQRHYPLRLDQKHLDLLRKLEPSLPPSETIDIGVMQLILKNAIRSSELSSRYIELCEEVPFDHFELWYLEKKRFYPRLQGIIFASGADKNQTLTPLFHNQPQSYTVQKACQLTYICPERLQTPLPEHILGDLLSAKIRSDLHVNTITFYLNSLPKQEDTNLWLDPEPFKNKTELLNTSLFKNLSSDLQNWLSQTLPEEADMSGEIKFLLLPLTTDHHFVQFYNDTPLYRVGDAAFWIPYFKALNVGLTGADHLIQHLNSPLSVPYDFNHWMLAHQKQWAHWAHFYTWRIKARQTFQTYRPTLKRLTTFTLFLGLYALLGLWNPLLTVLIALCHLTWQHYHVPMSSHIDPALKTTLSLSDTVQEQFVQSVGTPASPCPPSPLPAGLQLGAMMRSRFSF